MSEARFPKRRDDGTFTVRARFAAPDLATREAARAYVETWVSQNQLWIRIWHSASIATEERLELAMAFSSDPRVDFFDASGFAIVFEGLASSSTRWKDWAVRITDEVSSAFPEARFEKFDS